MTVRRSLTVLALCLVAFASLPGCGASSAWEGNYVGDQAAPLSPEAPVQVRNVAWERVQNALKEIEAKSSASDVHPEDWSEVAKGEVKATMLRGLQVSDDPASIQVLGRSSFRTTRALEPERSGRGEIAEFARKIGATRVAWSRSYLGKADTIVQEPVSTWSQGTTWGAKDGRGRYRSRDYSETSTTWVPIRVQADEYAFVAYFLRDERN